MVHFKKAIVVLSLGLALGCSSSPTAPTAVEVSPESVSIPAGGTAQLIVTGEDGEVVTEGVGWSSSDPVMVAVDDSGMVTGGYGVGTVEITAVARGVSDTALVAVLAACAEPLPINGDPDPNAEVQRFDVRFERGVDVPARTRQLASSYGFTPEQVTGDGFVSELTPRQAAGVGCAGDVESMTYL